MAISFRKEYKDFRIELAKKHKLYEQLEMSQEQIDALDAFDWEEFHSNNNYRRHTQSLNIDRDFEHPEGMLPLYQKFGNALSVELKVEFRDRYSWMEEISSPQLLKKLQSLSEEELSLLDERVFRMKNFREIGEEKNVTPQCVSQKIKRILKRLAKG